MESPVRQVTQLTPSSLTNIGRWHDHLPSFWGLRQPRWGWGVDVLRLVSPICYIRDDHCLILAKCDCLSAHLLRRGEWLCWREWQHDD